MRKFNPQGLWLGIEALLLCTIVFANSAFCILGLKLYDQYHPGLPLPWLSREIFHYIPYDPLSILACWIIILSTFIALGIASKKGKSLFVAVHLPITTTLAFVLLLYSVLIATTLPYLIVYDGLTPADYISPIPQPSVSPWIWLIGSGIYVFSLITFAWKKRKRPETHL